jgi:hypothetical protein
MKIEDQVQEILKNKFLTPERFSLDIERYVRNNSCNYIEGIVLYCEENEIEIETVSKLMTKPLKEKLKINAIELNYLKEVSKSKKVI